ncbi:MAG: pilus assembly protein [Selenomonadaceae bacterium]|nr:pilus assembly protein [Selenomonadaceae bacterium]
MKNQKGQAAVEFALVAVLFFTMCFGMIYGGMVFMDYLQYNNSAREAVRNIALATTDSQRTEAENNFKNSTYQLTKLYIPTREVTYSTDKTSVEVKIKLKLNKDEFPGLPLDLKFPPEELTIKVVMPLEHKSES